MKSTKVRSTFLDYFQKHDHTLVPSSRLVPEDDPTILFTNAGMNQFKNVFTGLEKRDYARATSSQKCVRAGGKHNDLENVGFTARHHTFFEMLGNFSFGDYFKKEAIHYSWDFITKELGLPKDKLYVTVFQDDDEAAEIWHKQEGIPKDRIYSFGEKDNFWRMGNTGPCGPCSEIFYDLGPEVGGDPKENVMGGEGDRYIEFWNLVFMQFNEQADGSKIPLPKPSVDTGMGLERLSTILQGKLTNYDNDLFQTLIQRVEKLSSLEYVRDLKSVKKDSERKQLDLRNVAMRVLSDHARATAFLIADGVLPSNDGRGYVLRRIMRRALRYGRNLNTDVSFLPQVISTVIEEMGGHYSELRAQSQLILSTAEDEQKRFFQTLDQGTHILTQELDKLDKAKKSVLDGKTAFKLYDTFGFPLDLTRLMAKERDFQVDEDSFQTHFNEARQIAKASWKGKGLSVGQNHLIAWGGELALKNKPTQFLGYFGLYDDHRNASTGKIIGLSNGEATVNSLKAGDKGLLVLDKTPFYAEGGGQVGDIGSLNGPKGKAEVLDTTKQNDFYLLHIEVTDGQLTVGENLEQLVDDSARRNTAANHSATHLMHAALRKVLGTHVTQAGSLVSPDRLRFDFTHNKSLSQNEIQAIEDLVNVEISKANPVETKIMAPQAAIEAGALALFGEKYGDEVRVLRMGEFSTELCGGTHVHNTAFIRSFKIASEGGVSSGVRRIEAITGDMAQRYLLKNTRENLQSRELANLNENWQQFLENPAQLPAWINKTKDDIKALNKQLKSAQSTGVDTDSIIKSAQSIEIQGAKTSLVFTKVDAEDRAVLSEISDKIRDTLKTAVVVLIGDGDTHPIIVSVSKDLAGKAHAGKLLGEVAQAMGGKGGGRPDFAQGAAKDLSKLAEAKAAAEKFLSN